MQLTEREAARTKWVQRGSKWTGKDRESGVAGSLSNQNGTSKAFSWTFLLSDTLGFCCLDPAKVWTVKKKGWRCWNTCCQRTVECWRGQQSCWWPHLPHGGSGTIAKCCCHDIDAELSGGRRWLETSRSKYVKYKCTVSNYRDTQIVWFHQNYKT